ncbi:GNAT family N-acetyltransferase [Paracoccus albus]|uniref:GNAT family N-acetyltransferase n=1 Tax=Paracoccus albus TaxID=3017784 RepID=UPI0022F12CE0|nr:GNAT family N-acetyltransferase [Paracoccus albus]WBU61501.1 GNAT family N-acetyltransferase [Paracoccus albus]
MDTLTVAAESPLHPDLDLLFSRHHTHCHMDTPPESIHMMDRSALVSPEIAFLVLRHGDRPVAMGALKDLGGRRAELKSMHVLDEMRGLGLARRLLDALIEAARDRQMQTVLLETGSQDSFAAARALYLRAGFEVCEPFGDYHVDANSVYMKKRLSGV